MSEAEEIEVDKDTANPSKAWERIRVHQQYIKGPHLDPSTPITEDKIRFVCISDTHGKIERSPLCMPPGDVLLHAGDFTMRGQMKEIEKFDSYLGNSFSLGHLSPRDLLLFMRPLHHLLSSTFDYFFTSKKLQGKLSSYNCRRTSFGVGAETYMQIVNCMVLTL